MEEYLKMKKHQEILEKIENSEMDLFLSNIHEVVVKLSEEVELDEATADLYQKTMGDLDKFIRVILSSKSVNEQKISDLEEVIDTLKSTVASMNQTLEDSKKECDKLREQTSLKLAEDSNKTTMDNEEVGKMQDQIAQLTSQNSRLEKLHSTSLDRLKQAEEELNDK